MVVQKMAFGAYHRGSKKIRFFELRDNSAADAPGCPNMAAWSPLSVSASVPCDHGAGAGNFMGYDWLGVVWQ